MEARKKVAGSISVYRGKAKQLSMSFHYHDCVLASGDFGQGFSITLLCYYEHYRTNGKLCYLKNTKLIFTPFDIIWRGKLHLFISIFPDLQGAMPTLCYDIKLRRMYQRILIIVSNILTRLGRLRLCKVR